MTTPSLEMAVDRAPMALDNTFTRPLIVIIEDDYRSSIALTMLIDDWGYSCVAARSSREAVRTLGHRLSKVAAIITDIEIDGQMRGIRDALAIAATIGHPVPTIITTGHADYGSVASPFPVVRKPFDPDILHRWLQRQVGTAHS